MPFLRKIPLIGITFTLALLFSVYAMATHQALAQSPQRTVPAANSTVHFTESAFSSNVSGNSLYINNAYTNNHPGALLFVTPNITPGGTTHATSDPHPIGVWYNSGISEWAIFNEDGAAMPLNAAFNVLVAPQAGIAGGTVFVQTAAPYNISLGATFLNNITTNGKPAAQVLVTQNWNPSGKGGIYNPHNVGVWYNNGVKEWTILNEDGATIPGGASFNVMVGASASGGGTEFIQTTILSNRSGNLTSIDNAATNNHPEDILFVTATPNITPTGQVVGIYEPHPSAVQYDTGNGVWAIANGDGVTMALQTAFNVLAFPS